MYTGFHEYFLVSAGGIAADVLRAGGGKLASFEPHTLRQLAALLRTEMPLGNPLALPATVEGQTTAHYITEQLKTLGVATSRLAHGVPVGGELDYLDEGTLTQAIRARRPL